MKLDDWDKAPVLIKIIRVIGIIIGLVCIYATCRMFFEDLIFINLIFRAIVLVIPVTIMLTIGTRGMKLENYAETIGILLGISIGLHIVTIILMFFMIVIDSIFFYL